MKFLIMTLSCALMFANVTLGKTPYYKPTKESLKNYTVPEWYQDAKFGIWPIWGVYSVPAFRGDHAAEWYGRWMYCDKDGDAKTAGGRTFESRGMKIANHHRKTYGLPVKFGYKDFIPMFKAERWDPKDWAQLAVDSGAKFFTVISEFHDGFAMYDSSHTRFNSVAMGPKRDITG
ncbi:MAG: alpha-L-fucosidase, partial [bacterium]|nr:alpha-L-fucosidase [bacterium]